jgi:Fe2+ or Zn2+ uptake regulation protein
MICNKDKMQETIKRLHAQGGRMTSQRRLIVDTLEKMSGHPTAEELYEVVRKRQPTLHLSTVYRTLRWLEQEGKVSSRRFEEDPRLERFDYAQSTEHHHFQCTSCRTVTEFDSPSMDLIVADFEQKIGARVETISLMLYGVCKTCVQNLDG